MNKRRLLRLVKHLETVPVSKFDMSTWGKNTTTPRSCGSKGCALGHAASIPEFQKLGYKLVHGQPYFNGNIGYQAASHLFDIHEFDAFCLFSGTWPHFDSLGRVTDRIKRFAKTGVVQQ